MTRKEVIEVVLRGILLVLSISLIGATSAYLGAVSSLCQYMELTHQKNSGTVIGTCEVFAYKYGTSDGSKPFAERSLKFESRGTGYWVLALSLVMFIYQITAILQLYCKCGLLNIKKACCRCTVTIFSTIDIIMMSLFSVGYFCGGISAAMMSNVKWKNVITFYEDVKIFYEIYEEIAQYIAGSSIIHACDAITGLTFLTMFFCIIATVYLLIASCVLKWPTHGTIYYEGEKLPN